MRRRSRRGSPPRPPHLAAGASGQVGHIHEPAANGDDDGLSAVIDPQLLIQVADVVAQRLGTDPEAAGDDRGGRTGGGGTGNPHLPRRTENLDLPWRKHRHLTVAPVVLSRGREWGRGAKQLCSPLEEGLGGVTEL